MNIVLTSSFTSSFTLGGHRGIAALAAFAVALFTGCASKLPAPVSDARPPLTTATPPLTTPAAKPGETSLTADAAKPSSASTAPTSLAAPPQPVDPTKFYAVQKGDTLYSIAFQHGLDRRELAAWNNIENPNLLRIGDNLRLTAPDGNTNLSTTAKPGEPVTAPLVLTPSIGPSADLEARPQNSGQLKVEPKAGRVPYTDQTYTRLSNEAATMPPASTSPATSAATSTPALPAGAAATTAVTGAVSTAPTPANENIDWAWPTKGKVTVTFTDTTKGIDIPGVRNAPVLAAAPGKVIYNKSGLRGYGRLVIIRHSETWLSAYAHNEKVLVAEDEVVKKGQKIAEMGSSDTDSVKLHFEIRKNGKPVDPLKFLPPQ